MIHRRRHVAALEPLESRRLFNAGDRDLAFGHHGFAAHDLFPGPKFNIYDVALQQDGKTVVAGLGAEIGAGSVVVGRLNVDGSVDQSFGINGRWDFTAEVIGTWPSLAVQGDGKIVVASSIYKGSGIVMAVVRLTATGQPDLTFGSGGHVHTDIGYNSNAADVVVQRDGKIVVAGSAEIGDNRDFLIVRYETSGEIDFYTYVGFGGNDGASAVAIDYTGSPINNPRYGSIVAVGAAHDDMAVLRLAPNGSPDESFDGDGKVSTDFPGESDDAAAGVVIQPDGRIVAVGSTVYPGSFDWDLAMARYLPNGSIDSTFGIKGTGKVVVSTIGDDRPNGVAMGFLGGIVVSSRPDNKDAVMAFTSDGALDTRFNVDGIVETNSGPTLAIATTGELIAPVRRVVAAGFAGVSRFFDVGSVIGIGSFDPNAAEAGQNVGTILVGRTQPLSTTERVYVNFGGTARAPYMLNPDYAVSGLTVEQPLQGPSYIDIPAGQTTASATIIPIDDTRNEGDETIVISLNDHSTYDIGTPSSAMLVIRDNDTVGGALVAPPVFAYDSGPQHARFTFNQDVSASIGPEDFTVTGPSGPVPFSFSHDSISNTSTLTFSGVLSDGDYVARAMAAGILNPTGLPMPVDATLNFFFMTGDADHDRDVDVNDLGILATNWQQSPRTFSQGDFDYSGTVDVSDLGILATRWQQQLALPSAPLSGLAAVARWHTPRRMIDELV